MKKQALSILTRWSLLVALAGLLSAPSARAQGFDKQDEGQGNERLLRFTVTDLGTLGGMNSQANAGQQAATAPPTLEQQIASEIQGIHEGEQRGMEPLKLGRRWAHLAADYEDAMEFAKSESAYNHALRLLESAPDGKADYAIALDNLGSMYLMSGDFAAAERCRKRSLAAREAMGDPLEVARGKAQLAEVELARHRFREARQGAMEAYNEMIALKDPDVSARISVLATLIYAECSSGGCADGLAHAREAASLARGAFPADSPTVGQTHMALGFAEWKNGLKDGPDSEMREGIKIMKEAGLPSVLSSLEQYRVYLGAEHREQEAKQVAQEETRMKSGAQAGCVNCSVSVYSLRTR